MVFFIIKEKAETDRKDGCSDGFFEINQFCSFRRPRWIDQMPSEMAETKYRWHSLMAENSLDGPT